MLKKSLFLLILVALILSGCNLPGQAAATPTTDPNFVVTAAAATAFAQLTQVAGQNSPTPSPTETPTVTPEPPTLTPTVEVKLQAYEATCTDNAAVRSWPGKGGEHLGGIYYGNSAKVYARSANANWWYVAFADSPTGYGWAASGAFKLKDIDEGMLPIALENADGSLSFIPPVTWNVVGTPLPLPTVSQDPDLRTALVVLVANIRTCPTISCQLLGYLQPGDQIILTGRINENRWAQFMYPSGPNGVGWVDRWNIEPSSEGFGGLPYFDFLGNLITPEPPTPTIDPNVTPSVTPTATPAPAGPLVEAIAESIVYESMSSLSKELGKLNPKDRVAVTAKSFNGLWYEIQYPPLSAGRAYISASENYIKYLIQDYRYLGYTDGNGNYWDANGAPITTP